MNEKLSHRPISMGQEPEFERYVSSIAGGFSAGRDRISQHKPSPTRSGVGSAVMATICLLGLVSAP